MYIHVCVCVCVITICDNKEEMNLLDSREWYMGGLNRKKRQGEMFLLFYNHKHNKRYAFMKTYFRARRLGE